MSNILQDEMQADVSIEILRLMQYKLKTYPMFARPQDQLVKPYSSSEPRPAWKYGDVQSVPRLSPDLLFGFQALLGYYYSAILI